MKSTRIMMHQPVGGAMGSADEVNIQATELNRTMKVSYLVLFVTKKPAQDAIASEVRSVEKQEVFNVKDIV